MVSGWTVFGPLALLLACTPEDPNQATGPDPIADAVETNDTALPPQTEDTDTGSGTDPTTTEPTTTTTATTGSAASGDVELVWLLEAASYGVWEATVTHDDSAYPNPSYDLWLTATFTDPDGGSVAVDGFYMESNTWKLRFVPSTEGDHTFTVDFAGETLHGGFTAVDVGNPGFIRTHPDNPYRLVFERDHAPFVGVGWEAYGGGPISLLPPFGVGKAGTEDGFSLEGDLNVDVETYLTAMADDGGGRMVRIGLAGQGWLGEKLWDSDGSPRLDLFEMTDNFFIKCREHDVRIYLDIYGWEHDDHFVMSGWRDAANQQLIFNFIRYINARFSAYVDIWELVNETSPEDGWISLVGDYLKSIDPYGHLVSISWERPDHASIDVNSPHIYTSPETNLVDTKIIATVEEDFGKALYGKPVILGELGDVNCNNVTEPWGDSTDRGRIWAYTSLFKEFYFVLWEANWVAGGQWCPGGGTPANFYFGPDERAQFKAYHDFAKDIDPDAVMDDTSSYSSVETINLYGLRSSTAYDLYVKSASNYSGSIADVTVTVDSPVAGQADWVESRTGTLVGSAAVSAGTNSLLAPPFVQDILLRIR